MRSRAFSGAGYGVDACAVEIEVNAEEAAVVEGLDVYPVRTLRQATDFLEGKLRQQPYRVDLLGVLPSFVVQCSGLAGRHAREWSFCGTET